MKNNLIFFYFSVCVLIFSNFLVNANEFFNFDVTEIEISENGNKIKGLKRGQISTNDGLIINADKFEFNKILNLFSAEGNIKIKDTNQNLIILADKIFYDKNKEIITGEGNINYKNKLLKINGNKFNYFKNKQIFEAEDNVVFNDTFRDIFIFSDKITYFKIDEKVISEDYSRALIKSKYDFISKNVYYFKSENILSSEYKTTIIQDSKQLLELEKFKFNIEKEILKGENVLFKDDIKKSKGLSNNLFFKNGFFDLKNKKFKAGETEIKLGKKTFNNFENDPRLKGLSSASSENITIIEKGIFTSCKKTDNCPPWTIQAKKITHDKNKKQLIYDDALLKVYNFPIFYFPKFFHPDPSVKRQSGFLQPKISNSKILGSSFSLPYFHAISENKDFTLKPTFFEKNSQMLQLEYRQENKDSFFESDFGFTNKFKSSETKDDNSISHFFSKFDLDLGLDNFNYSKIFFSLEKISKDTYLKLFDNILSDTNLKPANNDVLTSELKLTLNNEKFDFNLGMSAYEDLQKPQSDRYQFILPYYDFSTNLFSNQHGFLDFTSKGSNDLKNTNNLRTSIINDINFISQDKISYNFGNLNSFGFYLKNTNTTAKNDPQFKSKPDVKLSSIFEFNSKLPLVKQKDNRLSSFIPKISFRINPTNMINYSATDRVVTIDNIFNIDRLSLNDTHESGKSITYGIDYINQDLENLNSYTKFSVASVFRDVEEKSIPIKTTLNKKYSNIFGSIDHAINDFLKVGYDFSLNNDLDQFDYNALGLDISVNNFVTKFNFIKEDNVMGDSSSIENISSYSLNEKNFLTFKTRRNKKINLTEYYDLVYEYKNDCLTAGIKYKKTYYEDRELKPTKDLLFTITLIPLTSIDQTINQSLYRD